MTTDDRPEHRALLTRGARLILDAHAVYGSEGKKRIGYKFQVDGSLPKGKVVFEPDVARVNSFDHDCIEAAVLAHERGDDVFDRARREPPVVSALTEPKT